MKRTKTQKAPAYQWYPKDFMSDGAVMAMTLEQQGLYRLLLDVCWLENGLPMRPHELWRIGRCDSLDHFEQLWPLIAPKFYEKDGRWHHKRLDDERKKQANNRKQRKLAADKRWKLESDARNANALREQSLASPSPSPIAAPASNEKPIARDKPAPDPRVSALVRLFNALHVEKFGMPAAIKGAKDGGIIKALLQQREEGDIASLMRAFFVSPDPFIRQAGYTIGVFQSQIGKLIAQAGPRLVPVPEKPFEETELHQQMYKNNPKYRADWDAKQKASA